MQPDSTISHHRWFTMLSGANLLHCTYLCFVLLLIRPYTTVCQIMFIPLCSFTHIAQIDIKMQIFSYLSLLYIFSKANGEERHFKNNIQYQQTQTDSDTYRDNKTQTKTDLEIGTHKYRHTRTHMDSNLDRIIPMHIMLQTDLDRDRDRKSQTGLYGYIRKETNTGRHNVYEHITYCIIKVCIAVHKQRMLPWQNGLK